MVQKRDKNGKFVSKKKVVENPDCEPATKGFVKCIARKLYKHDHEQRVSCSATLLGAGLGFIAWLLTFMGFGVSNKVIATGWTSSSTIAFAFMMACLLVAWDLNATSEAHTCKENEWVTESAIKAWEEPKCEKKRDCDE